METQIVINDIPVQFEQYIARGNFGCVYTAYYGFQKVAVKISKYNLQREYDCLKKISNPLYYENNILVMEFHGDMTLKKLLDKVKSIPFSQKEIIMKKLLEQLHHLHKNNICHHDIKSENVIVNNLQPTLIDFGLATNQDCEFRKKGKGSIHYLPPEGFTDKMSFASDVWSLGVLFYEIISSEFPFFGFEELGMKSAILNKKPTSFMKKHQVPPFWENLIFSMLTKDQTKRLTCQEILKQF